MNGGEGGLVLKGGFVGRPRWLSSLLPVQLAATPEERRANKKICREAERLREFMSVWSFSVEQRRRI